MQEILTIGAKGLVLVCLFWRLGHTLKDLMKDAVSSRELRWFGVDGFVFGLAGGFLTSSSVSATWGYAVMGGLVFYALASLGMKVEDDRREVPRS